MILNSIFQFNLLNDLKYLRLPNYRTSVEEETRAKECSHKDAKNSRPVGDAPRVHGE